MPSEGTGEHMHITAVVPQLRTKVVAGNEQVYATDADGYALRFHAPATTTPHDAGPR